MDDRRFGDILSERRMQLGLSIDQAVAATKLRPQAIRAFEASNFNEMPPKGYVQGMLSTYARYLRLDEREVLEIYYEQLYDYERSREFYDRNEYDMHYVSPQEAARRRDRSGRRTNDRRETSRYERDRDLEDTNVSYVTPTRRRSRDVSVGNVNTRRSSSTSFDDDLYETRRPSRRDSFDYDYDDAPASRRRAPYGQDDRSNRGNVGRRPNRSTSRPSRGYGDAGSYGIFDRISDAVGGPDRFRIIVLVAAALLILIVLIAIATSVASCIRGSGEPEQTTPATTTPTVQPAVVPTQSAVTTETPAASSPTTTVAAGPREVTFEVENGESSWIEVTNGGRNVYAESAQGGASETFVIDGTFSMTVGNPNVVTVLVDGKQQTLQQSNGIGKYTYDPAADETE